MKESVREYNVTVTVELANGEPREAGEYGWSTGMRVAVYDWACPEIGYVSQRMREATLQHLKSAVDNEKERKRNNVWWRRLFRG